MDYTQDYDIQTRIQTHQSFINRLGYSSQLQGHNGCVNCLQWNKDGSLLASGSDDYNVHIWNVPRGSSVACMPTGHIGNIFSVKFVPFSGDHMILTGAEDREIRLHDLTNFDTVQVWSCCNGRVKRLAVSNQSPFLTWSASEDGCIRQYDTRERHSCSTDGRCRNVLIDLHSTCGSSSSQGYTQCKCLDVNSVKDEQLVVGGFDPYVRLYDRRILSISYPSTNVSPSADHSCLAHFSPGHITRDRTKQSSANYVAATYVCFSPCGQEVLANLSGEQVYLYNTVSLDHCIKYVPGDDGVLSLKRPLPSIPGSSCTHTNDPSLLEEGEVPSAARELRNKGNEYYQRKQYTESIIEYSEAILECPHWHILYSNRATALVSRNWPGDIYDALRDTERALSLSPTHIKSLKRRIKCLKLLHWIKDARGFLNLYESVQPQDKEFIKTMAAALSIEEGRNGYNNPTVSEGVSDWEANRQATANDYRQRYAGHCNNHTDIKEATFLGERGEYIGAGSDDGNVFIWNKRSGNLIRVLHGDESIVNCVQWNPTSCTMATSGIESVIKIWEPRPTDEDSDLVEKDMIHVCQRNQSRRRVDPFEMMLLGLRMIEDPSGDHVPQQQCQQS